MVISILDKFNHNAIFDEEELHHAPDGLQVKHGRQELQERNSYFLKRLKDKYFPVKSEDLNQVLFPFLKVLPVSVGSPGRRQQGRKRHVKKIVKYEELQLF